MHFSSIQYDAEADVICSLTMPILFLNAQHTKTFRFCSQPIKIIWYAIIYLLGINKEKTEKQEKNYNFNINERTYSLFQFYVFASALFNQIPIQSNWVSLLAPFLYL